jgi:hypothetical protein
VEETLLQIGFDSFRKDGIGAARPVNPADLEVEFDRILLLPGISKTLLGTPEEVMKAS